jgi:2-hydroxychromene-2-carboxylate isomerase
MRATLRITGLGLLVGLWLVCPQSAAGPRGQAGGAEKVEVELFVMSQCPFALQVEQALAPVLGELGGSVDLHLDFIGDRKDGRLNSMHGDTEVEGDKLQLCALRHFKDRALGFINCMNRDNREIPANWEGCAESLGLDKRRLQACAGAEATELLAASFDKASRLGVRGSPTLLIAGKPYNGARSALAFKRALCAAFMGARPAACASLPPQVRVPFVLVTDQRCSECQAGPLRTRLQGRFPDAEFTVKDYTTEEGKRLYRELGLTLLPVVLLGRAAEKSDDFEAFRSRLVPRGEYLELPMGGKFDPTKEICDNQLDDTGDGEVDCADPDCREALVCRPEVPARLDVFIMAQCPFAVRALGAMDEVLQSFAGRIVFNINFVGNESGGELSSMHGPAEVDEDVRELCAIKHYPLDHAFMAYIRCRNQDIRSQDWRVCTGENGIDAAVLEACAQGEGRRLLAENFKIAAGLGIYASPTWLANNKFTFNGITAEQIRDGLCGHNPGLAGCDRVPGRE